MDIQNCWALFFCENLRAISTWLNLALCKVYIHRLTWSYVVIPKIHIQSPRPVVQYVDDIPRSKQGSMCNIYIFHSILYVQKIENVQDIEIRWAGWLDGWMTQLSGLILLSIYCMHHFSTGEKKCKMKLKPALSLNGKFGLHSPHSARGAWESRGLSIDRCSLQCFVVEITACVCTTTFRIIIQILQCIDSSIHEYSSA